MHPGRPRIYGFSAHGGNADSGGPRQRAGAVARGALSFEAGAAVACGTGTAYGALKRLDVSGRDTLAVFGQGPVGLSATLLGAAMGARVIAVDVAPARLDLARQMGATAAMDASADDPVQAIRDLTHGEGADATMDCTGHATARDQAVAARGSSAAPAGSARAGRSTLNRRRSHPQAS